MPMQEAEDFRAESEALHAALAGIDPDRFAEATQFKGWTVNQVLRHLKFWNAMAILQIEDEAKLLATLEAVKEDPSLRAFEDERDESTGARLLEVWRKGAHDAADAFAEVDPRRRLKWAGPEMSARSSMTARLMETWAHGQEIFDRFGLAREETDRIKGICFLGVQTYRFAFANRGETPPDPPPYVSLAAPSGDVWAWGDPASPSRVEGPAVAFAQVVAQTRNVADTELRAVGEAAERWMAIAQCFAGGPNDPPPPGSRFRRG